MTRRTQTHITDTLAIREIISRLPENWLVRGLEERDYGIDLSIELYDGENPTGCFSLIQVKGTRNSFDENPILSGFPTKTLDYAALFPEAFFIFNTSISDKKTYFVWAQKYIETRLSRDTPNWHDQESNTIYFPKDNILGDLSAQKKIESIMMQLGAKQSGLEFLADFESFKLHWENYKLGQSGVIDTCVYLAKNIRRHNRFFDVYLQEFYEINFIELVNLLESLQINPPKDFDYLDEDDARCLNKVDMQMHALDGLKMNFLGQSDIDAFEEENSTSSPY